jgi:hypothetical protein
LTVTLALWSSLPASSSRIVTLTVNMSLAVAVG